MSTAGPGARQRVVSAAKRRLVRGLGATSTRLHRKPSTYRPGVTVLTVNWNSLPFLRLTLGAVRACSPASTELLVIDNGSKDGSPEYLSRRSDVRAVRSPINLGHGVALDVGASRVDTEYLAVLDVDAFPISTRWLEESITALDAGAHVAGAHMHRNFVHPCFLVLRTSMLHQYGLTFRPVGSLATRGARAPLFLDVAEALSQRVIVRFGGSQALHFFEISSIRGPGDSGAVFGELVYHNQYATQGEHRTSALDVFRDAFHSYHPDLRTEPDS